MERWVLRNYYVVDTDVTDTRPTTPRKSCVLCALLHAMHSRFVLSPKPENKPDAHVRMLPSHETATPRSVAKNGLARMGAVSRHDDTTKKTKTVTYHTTVHDAQHPFVAQSDGLRLWFGVLSGG